MGRLRPRPHGDAARATERGKGKGQSLGLTGQSSAGHDPLEKERLMQGDRVCNQPAHGMPTGRARKDKRIEAT